MSAKENFVCVECGTSVPMLYKKYALSVLKLEQCTRCDKVADKYIEYENVVVLMDVVLQKLPAYRHILLNSEFKAFWKLCVICLLFDAYFKWVQVKGSNMNTIFELEWTFYFICLKSILEFGVYIVTVLIYSYCATWLCPSYFPIMKLTWLLNALILANFGQLFVIPIIIWGQSANIIYSWLTVIFIALSSIQAYKAVTGTPLFIAVIGISLGFACRLWLSKALQWTQPGLKDFNK